MARTSHQATRMTGSKRFSERTDLFDAAFKFVSDMLDDIADTGEQDEASNGRDIHIISAPHFEPPNPSRDLDFLASWVADEPSRKRFSIIVIKIAAFGPIIMSECGGSGSRRAEGGQPVGIAGTDNCFLYYREQR